MSDGKPNKTPPGSKRSGVNWEKFFSAVFGVLLIVFLLLGIRGLWPSRDSTDRDSTDPLEGFSGANLIIDHATGCHYLSRNIGGITPRLDRDGNHVCVGYDWEPKE